MTSATPPGLGSFSSGRWRLTCAGRIRYAFNSPDREGGEGVVAAPEPSVLATGWAAASGVRTGVTRFARVPQSLALATPAPILLVLVVGRVVNEAVTAAARDLMVPAVRARSHAGLREKEATAPRAPSPAALAVSQGRREHEHVLPTCHRRVRATLRADAGAAGCPVQPGALLTPPPAGLGLG